MPISFSNKTIQITIILGQGSFSEAGNTKIIEGLACEVSITKPGLPEKNSAAVKIWGLKYEDMEQLTMLAFKPLESQHNTLEIRAGEKGQPLSLVFKGEITGAFADFNQAPDVAMEFEASTGSYPQLIAAPVATVAGEVSAANLFEQFTKAAGYVYKNEGLKASIKNAWFPGPPLAKIIKLARDLGAELVVEDGVVFTMPAGQPRAVTAVLLNKSTGLIGYPAFNQDGITCKCLYNPDLVYGGLIKVESIAPKASGVWKITKLTHTLSAYTPDGGAWESEIEAAYNE